MPSNSQDQPDEIALLRQQLSTLEVRVQQQDRDGGRARSRTAALTAGLVALFLSVALPWVRGGGGLEFVNVEVAGSSSLDGYTTVARSASLDGYATGWDLFGAALYEGRGMFVLTFVALLALLCFAVLCFNTRSRGVLLTTVVLSALTPFLYFVSWFPSQRAGEDAAGSGVFVMVVACVLIGVGARGAITDSRSGEPPEPEGAWFVG